MGLFGLFKPKNPLPPYEWEWLLASLKWLEQEFPKDGGQSGVGPIVLPTHHNFPESQSKGEAYAEELFATVKALADMTDWPTVLSPQYSVKPTEIINPAVLGAHGWNDAAGTFSLTTDQDGQTVAQITYNVEQLSNSESFVATMAHELAHYLICYAKTCPPGGWDASELTTDVAAVWMGFGVFQANSAKTFEGTAEGWQAQTQGYLGETMLVTALAVCLAISGQDSTKVVPYLKPHLGKLLKKAVLYLSEHDFRAEMAEIDLAEFGVEPVAEST